MIKPNIQNQIGQYFQTRNNIEDNFDGNVEDITESLKQDVINILNENNLSEDEFNIEDVRIYGSYSKGTNKATSDLDFVVLYSGTIREDDAFNILNDEKLTLTDKTGKEVEVDINPINNTDWGSIDEYLSNLETLEPKEIFLLQKKSGKKKEQKASILKSLLMEQKYYPIKKLKAITLQIKKV